jgi:hypothetical protein
MSNPYNSPRHSQSNDICSGLLKSWSCSLCNFFHPPAPCYLIGPSVFISILFCTTYGNKIAFVLRRNPSMSGTLFDISYMLIFVRSVFISHHLTTNWDNYPLSTVRECLFSIFAATFRVLSPSNTFIWTTPTIILYSFIKTWLLFNVKDANDNIVVWFQIQKFNIIMLCFERSLAINFSKEVLYNMIRWYRAVYSLCVTNDICHLQVLIVLAWFCWNMQASGRMIHCLFLGK